jgi:RimJ/RimL family protein N-acetyltransferase
VSGGAGAAFLVETARLGLRGWSRGDAPAQLAIFGDARVWAHLPSARGRVMGLDEAWAKVERMIATHAEHGLGHWALVEKATGEVVGSCGFRPPFEPGELEIGFTIAPWRWGRGYAGEIVTACAAYGLTLVPRVVALTSPKNEGARRVLEKAGLRYEGETFEDDVTWAVYSITRV